MVKKHKLQVSLKQNSMQSAMRASRRIGCIWQRKTISSKYHQNPLNTIDFRQKMLLTQIVNHPTKLHNYAILLQIVLMKRFLHGVYVFFNQKLKILICLGAYSKTNAQAAPKISPKYHQNLLKIIDIPGMPGQLLRDSG